MVPTGIVDHRGYPVMMQEKIKNEPKWNESADERENLQTRFKEEPSSPTRDKEIKKERNYEGEGNGDEEDNHEVQATKRRFKYAR